MTKQQDDECTNLRPRSAWASDQSLLSASSSTGSLVTHAAHSKDSDQTADVQADQVLLGAPVILLVLSCFGLCAGDIQLFCSSYS